MRLVKDAFLLPWEGGTPSWREGTHLSETRCFSPLVSRGWLIAFLQARLSPIAFCRDQ